jgi:copper oxidase (laccase) domain-containing protein
VFASTLAAGPVRVAFTDRHGGVEPRAVRALNLGLGTGDAAASVARNFALVAAALDVRPEQVVRMHQVHGNEVAIVRDPSDRPPGPTRSSPTSPGSSCACARPTVCRSCSPQAPPGSSGAPMPVGRAWPRGWFRQPVTRMRALGATDITAWIGPHICGSCYEVPAALRAEVAAAVPESYGRTSWGTPSVDLGAGVRAQLASAGCAVVDGSRCTAESPDLYSHRRDGRRSGRLAGLVWIRP